MSAMPAARSRPGSSTGPERARGRDRLSVAADAPPEWPAMNAWLLELIVVRARTLDLERRSLARDVAKGLLVRVRPGVYVERTAHEGLTPESKHIVAMRALAAVASSPPVFSHWSAAVLLGLPVDRQQLDRVHVTVEDAADRGLVGVAAHVAHLEAPDRVFTGGLLATSVPRTVVDVARASAFEQGVVVADGALHAGHAVALLEHAVAGAAGRKGFLRARAVVAFADGDAESAGESRTRVTMMQGGIRRPVLQWKVLDRRGLAGRLDFGFPWVPAGGEIDGEQKYRDAMMAPDGPAEAVIREKRREDRVRLEVPRLGRWGYREACSLRLLLPVLARIGVLPERGITIADYSSAFRLATF